MLRNKTDLGVQNLEDSDNICTEKISAKLDRLTVGHLEHSKKIVLVHVDKVQN